MIFPFFFFSFLDFQQGPPQGNNGAIPEIHPTNPCGYQSINPQQQRGMYVIGAPAPNPYIQYQHAAVQP